MQSLPFTQPPPPTPQPPIIGTASPAPSPPMPLSLPPSLMRAAVIGFAGAANQCPAACHRIRLASASP